MTLLADSAVATVANQSVGMGQVLVASAPNLLHAVLGSCIGVAAYHPRHRVGALAHVVLPDSADRSGHPGKFADTAIPYLLDLLRQEGVGSAGLTVRLMGGASMFGATGPMQIGTTNFDAVFAALQRAGIRPSAQHCGGNKGRRVTLDTATGEIKVEIAGQTAIYL